MHGTAGTATKYKIGYNKKRDEEDGNPHEFPATVATAFYYQGKEMKANRTYRYFYCSPFIQQHTFSHFLSQLFDNVYVHKKTQQEALCGFQ